MVAGTHLNITLYIHIFSSFDIKFANLCFFIDNLQKTKFIFHSVL